DQLAVNGTLDMTGSRLNIAASSGQFSGTSGYSWRVASSTAGLTGAPLLGTITLGTITGDFAAFPNGFFLTSDATRLYLNYDQFTWTGATWGAWGPGPNWVATTPPAAGAVALFSSASPNTSVSLGGTARPIYGVRFDSPNAAAYTIGTTAGDALLMDAAG